MQTAFLPPGQQASPLSLASLFCSAGCQVDTSNPSGNGGKRSDSRSNQESLSLEKPSLISVKPFSKLEVTDANVARTGYFSSSDNRFSYDAMLTCYATLV